MVFSGDLMTISLDSVPKKGENIIFRKIEDEYILVPMLASADEVEHIFNLNKIGAAVWERIDGVKSVRKIVAELSDEYDAGPGVIGAEVIEFLNDIAEAKIIDAA